MKVILTEKVATLGNLGEIVNVSAGYGRNYLIPNKLALLADEANQKELANQQRALQKKIAEAKAQAEGVKAQIEGLTLDFVKRVGGNGKLFGTITNTELAKEILAKKEIDIPKRQIVITTPIKALGTFEVKAKLFQGVEATFKVNVTMDPEQIKEQQERQRTAAERKAQKAAEDKLKDAQVDIEAEKAQELEVEEQTAQEIKESEN